MTVFASWNIQFGTRFREAAEVLAEDPAFAGADVLLLQEMDEDGTSFVADQLGFEWRYAMASVHPQSGRPFGNAILSRHPIGEHRVIELPHRARVSGQPRLAVVADIDIDGVEVAVASVHTEIPLLEPHRRRDQFRVLGRTLAAEPARPIVVGGDFNTATSLGRRRLRLTMEQHGLVELSRGVGPTLRRHGRNYALDHLYGRGAVVNAAGSTDGSVASDHNPVWIDVTLTLTTTPKQNELTIRDDD